MFLSIIMCLSAFILFNKCDGRFHHRNKLVRRQNAPMPPPSNMMQGSYPMQPAPTQIPLAYPNPVIPSHPPPPNDVNFLPPLPSPIVGNPPASSGSAPFPSALGQAPYPGNNPNFGPNGQTIQSQTLATYNPASQNRNPNPVPLNKRANLFRKNVPENSYEIKNVESPKMLSSYFNPSSGRIERRRKSVLAKKRSSENGNKVYRNQKSADTKRKTKEAPEKKSEMEKLLEEGKKILEISTKSKLMEEETSSETLDSFFENDDEMNGNVTVMPIPKGIQLKTNSEKDNKHIEETVNITSSTQKTLLVDNNTEIENVMEMEMEKKIEDDKGDSKGSEQVKIVETERVKPIMIKKGNSLTHKYRKRRFPFRNLFKQHRVKRSTTHSTSFYSKMMKKFFADLRRDRTVRMTGFLNRIESTTAGKSDAITKVTKINDWDFKEEKNISVRDKSMYNSDEIEEFLKQILDQLVKLRKIRDKNKLRNKHLQYSNPRHRQKHHNFLEHKKVVMNSNMTWDHKLQQHFLKSENKPERSGDISTESPLTDMFTSTTQHTITILYLQDKKNTDSRLLVVVIVLCVMTFLLPLLLCILPQVYETSKLKKGCSALKRCPFCPESESSKEKEGICRFHTENFAADESLQLEWQSDNGDWLSEKEIEFK